MEERGEVKALEDDPETRLVSNTTREIKMNTGKDRRCHPGRRWSRHEQRVAWRLSQT